MRNLKEYIYEVSLNEGLLDRVKNKEVNHKIFIEEFLKANYKVDGSYDIKETKNGFIVDAKGYVEVKNKNITSLTNGLFEFGVVGENFDCSYCKSLTSLEGAPKKVGETFYCYGCNSLTSLKGAPKEVGKDFSCSNCNSLKSLEGAPEEVGKTFYCYSCDSLKTLEGAPKEVGEDFNCSNCKSLTTLEGAPKKVGETFWSVKNKFSIEDIKKVVKAKQIKISL